MRMVVIKGFPFSGHELLGALLQQLTNAKFSDLDKPVPSTYLLTHLDVEQNDNLYCICFVNHPETIFSYWLASHSFPYRNRKNLEFWLEFNSLANKSWKEYYQNARQKNNLIFHYQDLVKRPKSIVRQVAHIGKARYHPGYRRSIDVRAMANQLWPQPVSLPTWFKEKIRDELQSTYESLGYEWLPCLSPTRLNMQFSKSANSKVIT